MDGEIEPVLQLPWLALILLWLTYGLVGWNLAAHHVIWFTGVLILALAMTLSWFGSRWIKQALDYISILDHCIDALSHNLLCLE